MLRTLFLSSVLIFAGPAFALAAEPAPEETLGVLLSERLPNTDVAAIDCDGLAGLCQIVTGDNVVYVDQLATRLFVGRVFDMGTGADLTAAARTALLVAGNLPPSKPIAWSALSPDDAIIRNGGAAQKIAVFTDLHCGYCQRLDAELRTLEGITVQEHLVGVVRSGARAKAVWCAVDREAALKASYTGQTFPPTTDRCDPSAIDRNTALFETSGFQGTPVIIREDGAVLEGYRDALFLKAWIAAGEASE